MAIKDRKITEAGIAAHGVVSAPDRLTGTAAENKKIFDKLVRNVVAECVNGLIDELSSTEEGSSGAEQIGICEVKGLKGGNIREMLESLKKGMDELSIAAGSGGYQHFGEGAEPAVRTAGYLYGKILVDLREVI